MGTNVYSLHQVSVDDLREFLALLNGGASDAEEIEQGRKGLVMLEAGDSRGPDLLTHAFARFLAFRRPSFVIPDMSLTNWEAQIERGVGMMLRPPSRLFVEAGMSRELAARFPIRLDNQKGTMAGAWLPSHLVGQVDDLLKRRLGTQLTRLRDSEVDPVIVMGGMFAALERARLDGMGLIEAMDVFADGRAVGQVMHITERKHLSKELRAHLEEAAKPPKKQSLFSRLTSGRSDLELRRRDVDVTPMTDLNGHGE